MPESVRRREERTLKQEHSPTGRPAGQGTIGWISLAMINLAIIYSVRGLPLMAEEGFQAITFMAVSAFFFLIPISLVTAELSSAWPPKGNGGVYIWVNEAFGKRWAFLAIWLQWSENVIWFPTVLSFIAATLAYAFSPQLAENKVYTLVVVLLVYWGGTFANMRGMKTSAWISSLGVVSTLITTGLIVVSGVLAGFFPAMSLRFISPWPRFVPDFTHMDDLVFLAGALVIVSGIEVSAAHASEVIESQKILSQSHSSFPFWFPFPPLSSGLSPSPLWCRRRKSAWWRGSWRRLKNFSPSHHLGWLVPVVAVLIVVGSLGEVAAWILGPSKGLMVSGQTWSSSAPSAA